MRLNLLFVVSLVEEAMSQTNVHAVEARQDTQLDGFTFHSRNETNSLTQGRTNRFRDGAIGGRKQYWVMHSPEGKIVGEIFEDTVKKKIDRALQYLDVLEELELPNDPKKLKEYLKSMMSVTRS